MDKKEILKDFRTLPGVGKSIAEDLWEMGYRSSKELKNRNPDELYDELHKLRGTIIDRCMLYTFRCMVYFVTETTPDPELCTWWMWSDRNIIKRKQQKD